MLRNRIKEIIEKNFKPGDISFQEFIELSKEHEQWLIDCQSINNQYKKKLKLEIDYLNFLVTKNNQFSLSLIHYFDSSKKAQRDFSPDSYSYKVIGDFSKIYIVISNNYILLRQLFLSGFDYQARVLFRNTIELTELCIAILGDEKYYHFFKQKNSGGDFDKGFKTVKFDTTQKTTSRIIKQIKDLPNNNFPKDIWISYLDMRKNYYEESSRYVHPNFWNLMLSSYVSKLDSTNYMSMNLGGIVSKRTKVNIKEVCVFDAMSYMIILILIIENHKLFFNKLDFEKEFVTILSKLNWDLLKYII
jgi:hypothetical protein